ncbi:hypothetical protein ANN_15993 [Periplaneta americana]|uniref:Uncharacterized protein n=1 Tax=Periplaneta americana TaxID=6978 RepID=A0ABQ8SIY7_PERAM|nr:hypothetical protein ANN_15993 [Periplaneta americana]
MLRFVFSLRVANRYPAKPQLPTRPRQTVARTVAFKIWRVCTFLFNNYIFVPFAVETFGSWSSEAKALISIIGRSLVQLSGDPRSSQYLRQRIGIAIQRGIYNQGKRILLTANGSCCFVIKASLQSGPHLWSNGQRVWPRNQVARVRFPVGASYVVEIFSGIFPQPNMSKCWGENCLYSKTLRSTIIRTEEYDDDDDDDVSGTKPKEEKKGRS